MNNTKCQLVVKSILLILILSVSSILPSWGQSGKLFNTDNQLSSNLATQVFQDKMPHKCSKTRVVLSGLLPVTD